MDSKQQIFAAEVFKALSNPLRLSIVELLKNCEQMNVTDIYKNLDIKQAIASHQLNILKNKGVLNSSRVGKKTYYSIKNQEIVQAVDLILNYKKI